MVSIEKITYIKGYCVLLVFSDNYQSEIDLEPFLKKGFARELLDLSKFKKFFIEPGGGIAWPNGFDICPNHLRKLTDNKELKSEKIE